MPLIECKYKEVEVLIVLEYRDAELGNLFQTNKFIRLAHSFKRIFPRKEGSPGSDPRLD